MTLPQRSTAATLPRPAAYGQRPSLRPAMHGAYPAARLAPAGARPQPGVPMVARRPSDERPAQRPVVSFLTVAEVAAIMRVSKMTVYRLVHGGELSAVRVGRSFRVPEPAVRAYLAEGRTDVA
jgi:excisionase family DNA binding protein